MTSSQTGPEDPTDLEEPVIDGPEPLTREDFLRDSRPGSNTVKQPLQRLPDQPEADSGASTSDRSE